MWEVLGWACIGAISMVILSLGAALTIVIVKSALDSTPKAEKKDVNIMDSTRR